MNIYVDDLRKCPNLFLIARNYKEAINLILKHKHEIDILSLDHDLSDIHDNKEFTGYDVCLFLCENKISPKNIYIHTDNVVGRDNMFSLLQGAKRRGLITSNIYKYPFVKNRM